MKKLALMGLVVLLLGSLAFNAVWIYRVNTNQRTFAAFEPSCAKLKQIPPEWSREMREGFAALGQQWLKHAIYCNFSKYQIWVPLDEASDSIWVLKDNKPFVMYQKGFGINLFQQYENGKITPYLTVQDWDNDGVFRRLDYALVDKTGKVIGNIEDKSMTGDTKMLKYTSDAQSAKP